MGPYFVRRHEPKDWGDPGPAACVGPAQRPFTVPGVSLAQDEGEEKSTAVQRQRLSGDHELLDFGPTEQIRLIGCKAVLISHVVVVVVRGDVAAAATSSAIDWERRLGAVPSRLLSSPSREGGNWLGEGWPGHVGTERTGVNAPVGAGRATQFRNCTATATLR